MSTKMVFCVPGPTDKAVDFHPVFKRGGKDWDYCRAVINLEGYDNELTGEQVTAYDCLLAIKECWKHDLAAGEVAICATPDTISDIKKAIDAGFPAGRINYDLMEEKVVVTKSKNVDDYVPDEDEAETSTEEAEDETPEIKDDEVKGMKDIKSKPKSKSKPKKTKVTK